MLPSRAVTLIIVFKNIYQIFRQITLLKRLLVNPGPGPWTLDPDPGPGPWKTWILKNLDPEKPGINIGLKNMSDFRELWFTKNIRNVSNCLKVRALTDI